MVNIFVISKVSRTSRAVPNTDPIEYEMTTSTTSATFEINNAKHYVPVVTFSINDNIEFLKNIKQGFSITIFGTNLDLKEHQNQKTAI